MVTKKVTTVLLLAVPAVLSRPDGAPRGVYVCDGTNWQGNCKWIEPSAVENCAMLLDASGQAAHIGSFGPDLFTRCTLFSSQSCKNRSRDISWPGQADGLPYFQTLRCRAISMPVNGGMEEEVVDNVNVVTLTEIGTAEVAPKVTRKQDNHIVEDIDKIKHTRSPLRAQRPTPLGTNLTLISDPYPYLPPDPLAHRPSAITSGGDETATTAHEPDMVPDGTPGRGVYLCDGLDFTGNCIYIDGPSFTSSPCKTIIARDPRTGTIVPFETRSIRPDMYGRCILYAVGGGGCFRDDVVDVKGYIPGGWGEGVERFEGIWCLDVCPGCEWPGKQTG